MQIHPRGPYNSNLWILYDTPNEEDKNNHVALSGTVGWAFDTLRKEAQLPEPHIKCFVYDNCSTNNTNNSEILRITSELEVRKPPIIITLGESITGKLCPETIGKKKPHKVQLEKYAGSLLVSPLLKYPHYIIPSVDVKFMWSNWVYRAIMCSIDFGHAREELEFYEKYKKLNPLPSYEFLLEPEFLVLKDYLTSCLLGGNKFNSIDIETIRPVKKKKGSPVSLFTKHPGYPYTFGIADSPRRGCSFSLWDYTPEQLIVIWRLVDEILNKKPQIGQNYFLFDAYFLEALGFSLSLAQCQDTLFRHHILWPELPHKLQFLTKQYTRQPYYKDEGKQWTPKYKKQLMRYNVLDVCVTYEVYEKQEEEFNERPYLK